MTAVLDRPATWVPARRSTALTFVVHGVLFSSWTAHIPAVQRHLQLSDGGLGLVLLGAPIGAVLSLSATGALLPRLGSRRAVRIAATGYCLAGVLVGLAGTYGSSPLLLAGALLLWGFGQGALDVSMNTAAVYVERAAGRPVMPGLHAGWGTGAFVGAGLGAAAVALGIGLVPQLAVLGVLCLAATLRAAPALLPDEVHEPGGRGPLRLRPVLVLLALAAFGSMLCEGAAADWSAVYLRGSTHAVAGVAGLGYTAFAALLVVSRASGNRLLRRRSARSLVPAGALVAAVGFGAALAVGDTASTLVGLALLGAGLGLVVPSCFAAAGRVPGLYPGRAVAFVSGLGWVGFVAGPPLIGGLASLGSLRTALVVLPVLALLAAAASRKALS